MQYRPKQIGDAEVRYALIQKGNRMLFVVGLNPSTADTEKPDPSASLSSSAATNPSLTNVSPS